MQIAITCDNEQTWLNIALGDDPSITLEYVKAQARSIARAIMNLKCRASADVLIVDNNSVSARFTVFERRR